MDPHLKDILEVVPSTLKTTVNAVMDNSSRHHCESQSSSPGVGELSSGV